MAIGSDVLKLIVDANGSSAIKEFDKLGQKVGSSVSGFEKFGQQATAALAVAVPTAAVAGGAAIAAFAAKGVSNFQNTALAAGKMADATGLTVEQASKWLEVADHIDVSETAVSSAFRRMDVAIGNNAEGFTNLGVQIARNRDGSANLSETFLRTATALQGIEDPTKRAAAAQKLFGKGYAEVAELIGRSSDDLRAQLQGVSDVKIITDAELEKARAFRGAMDDLGDAVQEAGMQLGQALVPGLTGAAQGLTVFLKGIDLFIHGEHNGAEATDEMSDAIIRGSKPLQDYARLHQEYIDKLNSGRSAQDMFIGSADSLSASFMGVGDAADEAAAAFKRQDDALSGLLSTQLGAFDSAFALSDAQRDFAAAVEESNTAASDGKTSQMELQASYDDQAQAALRAAEAAVKVAQDQAELHGGTLAASDAQQILIKSLSDMGAFASGPVKAQLLTMIAQLQTIGAEEPNPTVTVTTAEAQAKAADIQRKMDELDKLRPKPLLSVEAKIAQADADSIIGKIRDYGKMHENATVGVDDQTAGPLAVIRARLAALANSGRLLTVAIPHAKGGPVVPGTTYLVGEHGPELFRSKTAGDIIPNNKTQAMTMPLRKGGGSTATVVNLYVTGAAVTDNVALGRLVDEALAASRRRGNRAA